MKRIVVLFFLFNFLFLNFNEATAGIPLGGNPVKVFFARACERIFEIALKSGIIVGVSIYAAKKVNHARIECGRAEAKEAKVMEDLIGLIAMRAMKDAGFQKFLLEFFSKKKMSGPLIRQVEDLYDYHQRGILKIEVFSDLLDEYERVRHLHSK